MSAKWRRSIKSRKWLDFNDDVETIVTNKSKAFRVESSKPVKTVHYTRRFMVANGFGMRKSGDLKPLIDVFQENNWITIIAEIAGFNKESFKINVKDQKITLSAKSKERRYYKSLNLPKVVIPSDIHTTFKNGVLEIKLKKA